METDPQAEHPALSLITLLLSSPWLHKITVSPPVAMETFYF